MEKTVLFPTAEVPEIMEETESAQTRYQWSLAWDLKKGDFIRNGANRMMSASGVDSYRIWCCKTVNTERFTCLAYPAAIGTELRSALKEDDAESVEAAVERTISEALMVHPMTEYVRDFSFIWNADSLRCSFLVKGKSYEEVPLDVTIQTNK